MSYSVRPHRQQPMRLPRPWDSPGKNNGVSCHFLLQCMKVKMKVKSLSRVRLLVTPWTAAYQAPPSMGFSRQECWSGVPLPSPNAVLFVRTTDHDISRSLWTRNSFVCLHYIKKAIYLEGKFYCTIETIYCFFLVSRSVLNLRKC